MTQNQVSLVQNLPLFAQKSARPNLENAAVMKNQKLYKIVGVTQAWPRYIE